MKIIIKAFLLLGLGAFLTSCTYNVSMAHTEGEATDVVDSAQDAKASPAINVPVQSSDSGQNGMPSAETK
jgi:hypothetical protein